jgi:NADPH:quinone reductase-like Zn-dependent oxidoreductase
MGTKEDFEGAYEFVARGAAKPIVDRVFPLEQAAEAHAYLEDGRQFGKVVLAVPP